MSSPVTTLLETAGLPADNLLARRDTLPEPLRLLHRRTLLALGEVGEPPTREQLQDWADDLSIDLDTSLHQLAQAELVFLDSAGRDITGGVPFAAGPTAHRVRIHDGPTVFANCAVDALGMGAMLGRDVDVRSRDALTSEEVSAISRDGHWTWQPVDAVVFVGSSGQGRLTETCCPVINFFTTAEHARDYQRTHALDGVVLTLADAVQAGTLVFGDLLHQPADAARPDRDDHTPARNTA